MTVVPEERTQVGWTVDDSTFGARLALVRHRMGWNLKEAARECGIKPATWRDWEISGAEPRGKVEISAAIAERVGCDFGWLLAGRRLAEKRRNDATLRYRPSLAPLMNAGPRASRRPIRSQPDDRLAA